MTKDRDESGRKLTLDEQNARDEAHGDLSDGRTMLINGSGEIKKITADEWNDEKIKADLLKRGWKEVGRDEDAEG